MRAAGSRRTATEARSEGAGRPCTLAKASPDVAATTGPARGLQHQHPPAVVADAASSLEDGRGEGLGAVAPEDALVDLHHLLEEGRVPAHLGEQLDPAQRRRGPERHRLRAEDLLLGEGVEGRPAGEQQAHDVALEEQRQRHPRAQGGRPGEGQRPLLVGVADPHRLPLPAGPLDPGVGEERAHQAFRRRSPHRVDAQAPPRLCHRHQGEVRVDHAPELLQHLAERVLGTDRAVDGLEGPAQLLGVLAPLALPLDREGGVEPSPLAGDRLAQGVHHLAPQPLVRARPAAQGGQPALDVAKQAIDVQTGRECTPAEA